MLKEVISAVSNSIYNEFGSTHKIYADNIEQNLTRPSFFLNIIRPAVSEKIMNRSHVSIPMVVQYFPSSKEPRMECYEVADRLVHCLKYPEFDDVVYRGTDLKFDINDDKLNFYVQYNFFARTYDPDEVKPMQEELSPSVTTNREDDA